MEEKKRRYLYKIFTSMPRWKKALAVVLYTVAIFSLMYFVVLKEERENYIRFCEESYEDVLKAVKDVEKNGIDSQFEDVDGKLTLDKYKKHWFKGTDEYQYTYVNLDCENNIYVVCFGLEIQDGKMIQSTPFYLDSREKFALAGIDIVRIHALVLTIVIFGVTAIVCLVSCIHSQIDIIIAERKSKKKTSTSIEEESQDGETEGEESSE